MNKLYGLIEKYKLTNLLTDPIFQDDIDIVSECRKNWVSINFPPEEVKLLEKKDFVDLINLIIDANTKYITDHSMKKMHFYLWYDEQSNCLSYSLITAKEPLSLPFECKLQIIDDLNIIISHFYELCINYSLNISDFNRLEDLSYEENEGKQIDFELPVYYKTIG